ncbi:peptidyl-prolyl cis-trans isomerase [Blastococcus sp. TML/M2B]|uniref:peptidylprolyl isomerase n=1 Tax=unclassified Blastococcus TaxID=2619396 RepID=UPI0019092374|nr:MULTISPECIES: peptidylprolyl isomerase [unclassified Blastococcus]MBN1091568.1 peptidyl-prolyl cis-trans isomerase [Blastococcus sp. TML/M2B]MBN1094879.1 peptidyl-prolyl cis-trans isomerase [Blastococcus sp. TML/C7B]
MLIPRAPRVAAAGLALALALPALAACRTSPDVAAYVGDARVTVTELQRGIDERIADEGVAAFADRSRPDFARRVLGFLVEREVYAEVQERYDLAVGDDEVRDRIDELMGDDDPDQVYAELAAQGVSRTDVTETIRQQLVREQVAAAEGAAGTDDDALRELYGEAREEFAQLEIGYVTVPDEATAAAVLAELTAAPDGYAAVAARYPGDATLPALARRAPEDLPPVLREQFTAAAPGTGFTVPVQDLGVVVGFVTGEVFPPFEELRDELRGRAGQEAEAAGAEVVARVRADLDLAVNPRYGVLDDDGRLVRNEGGVVEIVSGPPEVQPAAPGD